jgi:hypothetical protein
LAYEHWFTSDDAIRPATIRYTPLDDLNKISAQIKQAIHLDNVTLHQQYKYQTGKKRYRNFYQKSITAADNNTGKNTNDIAVTKKAQIVKGNLVIPSVLKLITVYNSTIPLRTMQ